MTATEQIDQRIRKYADWREELYNRLRTLINQTEPKMEESWKWDTAVWTLGSNVRAISAFKDYVKLNFFEGAALLDPDNLFNSGLKSKRNRSINFTVASPLDQPGIQKLIMQATLRASS